MWFSGLFGLGLGGLLGDGADGNPQEPTARLQALQYLVLLSADVGYTDGLGSADGGAGRADGLDDDGSADAGGHQFSWVRGRFLGCRSVSQ